MATANVLCNYNRYKSSSGSSWMSPESGTNLLCGKNGSGVFYAGLLRFANLSSYASASIQSASLNMYRYVNQSSAAKSLRVAVVTANVSSGGYTIVAGPVGFDVSAGVGPKSCNITTLVPHLMADLANRYLMVYSSDDGQYTEFRSIEYGSGTHLYIALTYEMGSVLLSYGGTWHRCDVALSDGTSWYRIIPCLSDGSTWYLLS